MFLFLKKTRKHPYASSRGFTLLEMIVSIFIFRIVVTIASGAMLSMINDNRKALALKTVMNNVNWALDSMSRDIRFGTGYSEVSGSGISSDYCPQAPQSCVGLQVNKGIGTTQYFLSKTGTLVRKRSSEVSTAPHGQELTASGATIQSLSFSIDGTKVQVLLSGYAGRDPNDSQNRFDIQTTMTQRNL